MSDCGACTDLFGELEKERAMRVRLTAALSAAGVALEHWREAALWPGHNRPGIIEMARRATAEYDMALALTRRGAPAPETEHG